MNAHNLESLVDAVYSHFPAELRALPQWVCWKSVKGEKKPTKVPYSARTMRPASSTNPHTWATLEEACDALLDACDYTGVGFVFSPDDPYVGIDLDACIETESSGLADWASQVLSNLNSYSELSPSGSGVHVIVKGVLPGQGRKKGKIEIYDQGRYFTVTGRALPTAPREVEPRQRQIEQLLAQLSPARPIFLAQESMLRQMTAPEVSDAGVLAHICASSYKRRFQMLYGGSWQRNYSSQSEADIALAGILATFVGNNPAQIDRLFRRSKLYRPKWDELRGSATYGQRTVQKVLLGGEQP
jgi:putative DNA primase/helicase